MMTLKKQFGLFIFLLVGFQLHAQNQQMANFAMRHLDSMPRNSMRFAPLNLVDLVSPSIDIGYEHLFNQKYAIQGSVGIITQLGGEDGLLGYEIDGIRLRLEGKQYVRTNFALKQYWAIDVGHLYQIEYGRSFSFGKCENCFIGDVDTAYGDRIDIVRHNSILNFKYGIVQVFQSGFLLDAYVGLGVKYRRVSHRGRKDEDDFLLRDELAFISIDNRNEKGNTFTISLPINIKLGYRF